MSNQPLTLTLKEKLTLRLDMSAITPNVLEGLTPAKIAKVKLSVGKKNIALEKLFEITGEDTNKIIIKKGHAKFDSLGRGMTTGLLEVRGDAGDRLGQEMTGGEIIVKGDAGDWVGTGMKKGRIEIRGNAGRFLGGALPGQSLGMKNGTIHVFGNVADRMGDRMRRGMIVVEGDAGDYAGSRMTAGTIVICGEAGNNIGHSMKRGTILLNHQPNGIPDTFNSNGVFELAFLNLLFKSMAASSRRLKDFKDQPCWVERYAGDLANDGLGEVLILQ